GPEAVAGCVDELGEAERRAALVTGHHGVAIDVGGEERGEDEAGDGAGGEELDDRSLRGDAVEDEADRGRDEVVDGAGGDQEAGREFLAVALLAQALVGEAAYGGDGGGGGGRGCA